MPLQAATVYAQQLMALEGITTPTPQNLAFYNNVATMILSMLADATVIPTTLGVPSLISAAPGSPVTGTGSLL